MRDTLAGIAALAVAASLAVGWTVQVSRSHDASITAAHAALHK